MTKQKVEVVAYSSMPLTRLFSELADHNKLGKVLGVPVRRIKDGKDDVNGVGSVRMLGFAGPLSLEETVTKVDPNRMITYRISKGGGPIEDHIGKLEFAETDRGSRVIWTIRFNSKVPLVGSAVKVLLTQGIRRGLNRLA